MIKSVSNIAWDKNHEMMAYHLLASKSIKGLEIAPSLLFHESGSPLNPDDNEIKRIQHVLKFFDLKIVSMQSIFFGNDGIKLFDNLSSKTIFLNDFYKVFSYAIELANKLNIPNIVFGSPKQRIIPYGIEKLDAYEFAADTFRKLGDLAKLNGTVISIEATPAIYGTNFLNSLEETINFVDSVSHPSIMINLDIGEQIVNGKIDELPKYLYSFVEKVNHIHISEPFLEPAPQNVQQVSPIIHSLVQLKYKKAVSIEMMADSTGLKKLEGSIDRFIKIFELDKIR